MYRLFSLSALLFIVTNALPKSPKIYNVLISTKKNLSPSHALPIFEPVLRTTSIGFALPPIYYHQSPFINDYIYKSQEIEPQLQVSPENTQKNAALPLERFIPYSYRPELSYNMQQFQPKISNQYTERGKVTEDPKNVIANLKRNPEIPDVQPPALPVTINKSTE